MQITRATRSEAVSKGLIAEEQGQALGAVFGLGMTLIAFWPDIRSRPPKDFAFWLYLFGVLACWRAGAR